MDSCYMCECVYRPKAIAPGVNELQSFNGYTVDFRLKQFRKIPSDAWPEFIDFDSPEGIELCAEMHEAAVKQLHKQFGKEVFISI